MARPNKAAIASHTVEKVKVYPCDMQEPGQMLLPAAIHKPRSDPLLPPVMLKAPRHKRGSSRSIAFEALSDPLLNQLRLYLVFLVLGVISIWSRKITDATMLQVGKMHDVTLYYYPRCKLIHM